MEKINLILSSLSSVRFPISSSHVNILPNPSSFYHQLLDGISRSKKNIALSSLYIGNQENELIQTLYQSLNTNKQLKLFILLDYYRGTRDQKSFHCLEKLKRDFGNRCEFKFYKTPNMPFFMENFTRWNEALGLQHSKMCVFDQDVLLCGANLNHDYFTNRQDRYILFKSQEYMAQFYIDLLNVIGSFSGSMSVPSFSNYTIESSPISIQQGKESLLDLFTKWNAYCQSQELKKHSTWCFPVLQLGLLGFRDEEHILMNLLKHLHAIKSDQYQLCLSSAYLNFPKRLQDLFLTNDIPMTILTSSPEANGFYGSKSVSKYLPDAYTYLSYKLYKQLESYKRLDHVSIQEYKRKDWTFHAKGIWILNKTNDPFLLTSIGSSNFNARSLDRDLEMQCFLTTSCPELVDQFENVNFISCKINNIEF